MKYIYLYFIIFLLSLNLSGCVGTAASAQEYFSIGMAYYDLGKFDEAEKWLNRARMADRTMVASQYNLGRIAFETQKYDEAAKHFESILRRDEDNILALKAAAFTRIKTGDFSIAEKHYRKLLLLVPESTDDGYNHALVLYAMERYGDAEKVLEKYQFALLDNNEVMLLYARAQKAQDKVEAIDSYSKWLNANSDAKIRYEYAQLLEHHEFYARAMEEYRAVLSDASRKEEEVKRSDVRFSLARLLLIADGESGEGVTELEGAVSDGYDNIEAVEELQKMSGISSANKDSLRKIINDMQRTLEEKEKAQAQAEEEQAVLDEEEILKTDTESGF